MTLQDLLDELTALPASARTATIWLRDDVEDYEVDSVRYEGGKAFVEFTRIIEVSD